MTCKLRKKSLFLGEKLFFRKKVSMMKSLIVVMMLVAGALAQLDPSWYRAQSISVPDALTQAAPKSAAPGLFPGNAKWLTPDQYYPVIGDQYPFQLPDDSKGLQNGGGTSAANLQTAAKLLDRGVSLLAPARVWYQGGEAACVNAAVPGGAGWQVWDFKSEYTTGFTGNTKLCARDFIAPCKTFMGVLPCNKATSVCVNTPDTFQAGNGVRHPEYTRRIRSRPQVCVSKGAFMTSDAAVVIVAQVVFTWIIGTLGLALIFVTVTAEQFRDTTLLRVLYIVLFLPLTCLIFSYFYFNAILGFAVVYASYQLFSRRRAESSAFAFVFIVLAILWYTFENGLGDMQHQSRFRVSNGPAFNTANQNQYENFCLTYFRGYWFLNPALMGDFDNPSIQGYGYCDRFWLSTELFFIILLELGLLLGVVIGGSALWAPREAPKSQAEETEMTAKA